MSNKFLKIGNLKLIENCKLKIDNFKSIYVFILGREQKIARVELECVLRYFGFCFDILSVAGNVVVINIDSGENLSKYDIMSVLGGTMEIFQIIGMADKLDPDIVYSQITTLSKENQGRVTFGISDYSKSFTTDRINTLGLDVKKKLKESTSVRFVALRDDCHLSAAAIISNRLHKDGILLGMFECEKQFLIGRLIGVSDPSEWSKRDFDKPKSDKYSGMTPPKLARALINITLSHANHNSSFGFRDSSFERVVVDPFCGSGNILMEAAVLGCEIIGSDISEKAVNNTKANLEWLSDLQNLKIKTQKPNQIQSSKFKNFTKIENKSFNFFTADATGSEFTKKINELEAKEKKNIIIVTEPFLGSPKKFKSTLNAVKGEYQKVKPIYLDFLNNLKFIEDKLEAICLIFPLVETVEEKKYSLYSDCVDEIREMGYTLTDEPFIYGREYQVVKRQIAFLRFKP